MKLKKINSRSIAGSVGYGSSKLANSTVIVTFYQMALG